MFTMTRWSSLMVMGILVMVACTIASAALPGDTDGDGVISRDELAGQVIAAMAPEKQISRNEFRDLQDAAWIYLHWNGTSREVSDSAGRTSVLSRPLRRIVVMNSETLETMRSLGIGRESVVAVDKYNSHKPEFYPEYAGYPSVGSIWAPDYEKIISLQPDAVFLYASVSTAECDEIERRVRASLPGVYVFRFDCYRPETYLEDAGGIALIFGKEEEFERLSQFYTDARRMVELATSGGSRPLVYIETWNDYKSAARGSGYHDKVTMAGGENIFGDSDAEYPEVDPESIIARRPEVVVKLTGSGKYIFGGYSGENRTRFAEVYRDILARPGWSSLPAVRDGRVYVLHNAILGGPEYIIGVTYMARWFHPRQAGDLDPENLHRRYLEEFQGLSPSLARPDMFIYPSD
jgi:iron complex transport system substrate-binding protein